MNIYPLKGAGNIEFGMHVSVVRKIMFGKFEEFRRIEVPEDLRDKHPSDHYVDKGIFCYYDENGHLEAMEFTDPSRPTISGVNILNIPFRKAEIVLRDVAPDLVRDFSSAFSRRWSLAISKPGRLSDPAETFLTGRSGLYDEI